MVICLSLLFWIKCHLITLIRRNIHQVQDASGNTTQFKIKTATALKKLMSTYCERNGLDVQVYTKRCLFTKLLSKRVFRFTI